MNGKSIRRAALAVMFMVCLASLAGCQGSNDDAKAPGAASPAGDAADGAAIVGAGADAGAAGDAAITDGAGADADAAGDAAIAGLNTTNPTGDAAIVGAGANPAGDAAITDGAADIGAGDTASSGGGETDIAVLGANPAATNAPYDFAIGLYAPYKGVRYRLTEYASEWTRGEDIDCFEAIASTAEKLGEGEAKVDFKALWKGCWDDFPDFMRYRIGYEISATLKTGEQATLTVTSPGDVPDWFTRYVEVYLYDDISHGAGEFYTHLSERDMGETTIMSSVKLTCGKRIDEVAEIRLAAFLYVYGQTADFDPETGAYIGGNRADVVLRRSGD